MQKNICAPRRNAPLAISRWGHYETRTKSESRVKKDFLLHTEREQNKFTHELAWTKLVSPGPKADIFPRFDT